MKARVLESIVMPGGWHKPELDKLGRPLPSPIKAPTYKALIDAVAKFRADNGIPVGDPKSDIDEYICTTFPRQCALIHVDESAAYVPRLPSAKTLTDRMLAVMDKQVADHSTESLELKSEAMRRADICLRCPFNVRWNSGCPACSEAVNRMSFILRSGQRIPNDRRLKACAMLCHENRSAVWLRLEKIPEAKGLPNFCWARR